MRKKVLTTDMTLTTNFYDVDGHWHTCLYFLKREEATSWHLRLVISNYIFNNEM